jgi:hypothetical protein
MNRSLGLPPRSSESLEEIARLRRPVGCFHNKRPNVVVQSDFALAGSIEDGELRLVKVDFGIIRIESIVLLRPIEQISMFGFKIFVEVVAVLYAVENDYRSGFVRIYVVARGMQLAGE